MMQPVIIEPNGCLHDMRFAVESAAFSAGATPRCICCGNNADAISSFLRQALKSSRMVFLIGGMEPDGNSRSAAAAVMGVNLVQSAKAIDRIKSRCIEQQEDWERYSPCAMLPKGAVLLPGDNIIPACFCAVGDSVLILLDSNEDKALLESLSALMVSITELEAAALPAAKPPTPEKVFKEAVLSKPAKKPKSHNIPRPVKPSGKKAALFGGRAVMAGIAAVLLLTLVSAALLFWPDNDGDKPQNPSSVIAAQAVLSEGKKVYKPSSSESSKPQSSSRQEDSSEEEPSSEAESSKSSSQAEEKPQSSSQQSSAAAPASSQEPEPVAVSEPPESSQPEVSSQPEPSQPVTVWQAQSQPASSQPEQPASSQEPEQEEDVYIYIPEDEEEEEDEPRRVDDNDLPSAKSSAFDEKLSYTSGGAVRKMNAYDLVCQILQNETRGLLEKEALKAHAVATYTMIKYNNQRGTAPSVALNSDVSSAVEDAVEDVLGVAVYYNGSYANTVYHSTSCGYTTSSKAVWGGDLPYLTPVKSGYDTKSPYYKSSYTISASKFAKRVESVYGIELDGDPEDWITAERDAPGGYVGTVKIGGEKRSQGGSYGSGKAITGRSVREQLLSFAIRSHCFEVKYDERGDQFVFTVFGYGHGVGMSQYGAHFMAQEGYNFVEILNHYYSDTEVY